jgi:hypothetical protein
MNKNSNGVFGFVLNTYPINHETFVHSNVNCKSTLAGLHLAHQLRGPVHPAKLPSRQYDQAESDAVPSENNEGVR